MFSKIFERQELEINTATLTTDYDISRAKSRVEHLLRGDKLNLDFSFHVNLTVPKDSKVDFSNIEIELNTFLLDKFMELMKNNWL